MRSNLFRLLAILVGLFAIMLAARLTVMLVMTNNGRTAVLAGAVTVAAIALSLVVCGLFKRKPRLRP